METRANDGSDDQLWKFDSDDRIVNKGSGLAIDGSGTRPELTNLSPLTVAKCWTLRTDIKSSQESGDIIVPKLATSDGRSCLNTANRFLENGVHVIMYPCKAVHPDNAGWNIVLPEEDSKYIVCKQFLTMARSAYVCQGASYWSRKKSFYLIYEDR